jgi:hypothetical protein
VLGPDDRVELIHLDDSSIEVYTTPLGDDYGSSQTYTAGDSLCTTAFPDMPIAASDLLP